MRTAIYGAGSLGTILGAYLSEADRQVDLINHNKAHVDALNSKGARITGRTQKQVPVTAMLPEEMRGQYDLIFLITKQLDNRTVVQFLNKYLKPDGVICTLQNGIPEISVSDVIGAERTCGGTAAWGATLIAPGVCELTSGPEGLSFGMGGMEGFPLDKLLAVKEVLEDMCPVELEENFIGVRWSKLLINATFSGLGTAFGGTFGDVADHKQARRIALATIKECIDTGHAAGVVFAPVQGKDIYRLMYYTNPIKRALSLMILPIALREHRAIKPSMLQDIEKGKPCEIDAINGVVSDMGRRCGIKTPFNDTIVEIVKDIQKGHCKPGFRHIGRFDTLMKQGW